MRPHSRTHVAVNLGILHPQRQNARKRGWQLKFCTICTKAVHIEALHRFETPDLINKTGIYADYLCLIWFAKPRRWYVSYKIRVRGGETVHYGRTHHQHARRLRSSSGTMRGMPHYRPAHHGRARTVSMPKSQGLVAFRHASMQHQRLTRCRIGMRCDSRVFSLASSPVCVCRLCGRMLCWDRFLLRSLGSRRTAFQKGIFSQRALVRTARARSSRPRSNQATPAHCRRGRSVRASRWSSDRVPWHHRAALQAVRRSRPRQTTRSSPRFRRLSHER